MKKLGLIGLALSFLLPACSGVENPDEIDEALLAEYRMALPSETQVMATAPEASQFNAVGDPALFPGDSVAISMAINGQVTGIITLMEAVVNTPPTVFNSAEREFFWGPFPNEDGYGFAAAYIKEVNDDFKYQYALLRGVDNDLANLKPVIFGAANPDPNDPDNGVGITLWDFEANYEFEQAANPNPPADLPRGRFAALYGAGPGENGERVALNFAVFRGFSDGTGDPADLDYLYGRVDDGTNTLDFLDWATMADVDDDPARPGVENLSVRMAFVNEGMGRAEVVATEGDFGENQMGTATECWDASISRTFLEFEGSTDGTVDFTVSEGDETSCDLFQSALADLGIPQIGDIDGAVYDAMNDLATNGVN